MRSPYFKLLDLACRLVDPQSWIQDPDVFFCNFLSSLFFEFMFDHLFRISLFIILEFFRFKSLTLILDP